MQSKQSPVKDDQTREATVLSYEATVLLYKEYTTDVLVGATPTSATSVRAVDQRGQPVRASGAPLTLSRLAIDGTDLLEIGIEPGPELDSFLGSPLDQRIVNDFGRE